MEVPDADSLGFQGSGPVYLGVLPDLAREGHGDEVEGGAQLVLLSSQMAVAAFFSLCLCLLFSASNQTLLHPCSLNLCVVSNSADIKRSI